MNIERALLWLAACVAALAIGLMIGQVFIGAAFAFGGLVHQITLDDL